MQPYEPPPPGKPFLAITPKCLPSNPFLLIAYNPETDYVPPYAPPDASSKANPAQQINVQDQEVGVVQHDPPPGPPPGHIAGGDLGESSGPR